MSALTAACAYDWTDSAPTGLDAGGDDSPGSPSSDDSGAFNDAGGDASVRPDDATTGDSQDGSRGDGGATDGTVPLEDSSSMADTSSDANGDSGAMSDAPMNGDGSRGEDGSDGGSALDGSPGDASDAATQTDAPSHDASASDAPPGDGAPPACSTTNACPAGSYCQYPDHYCGSGQLVGTCVAEPTSCNGAPAETVCGCNGTLYTSRCAAEAAGEDLSDQAACATPGGDYRCGFLFCSNTDMCVESTADAGYACESLGGCGLGCLCTLVSGTCASPSCSSASGHVVVTCP